MRYSIFLVLPMMASQPNPELNKSFHKLPICKYTRMELEKIEKELKKEAEDKQEKQIKK